MNIIEGGRRLVAAISWIVAIRVSLAGMIYMDKAQANILWWGFALIIGVFAGLICSRIGLWILDGFMVDQEKQE